MRISIAIWIRALLMPCLLGAVLTLTGCGTLDGYGRQEMTLDEARNLAQTLSDSAPKGEFVLAPFYMRKIDFAATSSNSNWCGGKVVGTDIEVLVVTVPGNPAKGQLLRVGDCMAHEPWYVEIWHNQSHVYLVYANWPSTVYQFKISYHTSGKYLLVNHKTWYTFKSMLGGLERSSDDWDHDYYATQSVSREGQSFHPEQQDPRPRLSREIAVNNKLKKSGQEDWASAKREIDAANARNSGPSDIGSGVVANINNNTAALNRIGQSAAPPSADLSYGSQTSRVQTANAPAATTSTMRLSENESPKSEASTRQPKRDPHQPYVEPNPYASSFLDGADKKGWTVLAGAQGTSREAACQNATSNGNAEISRLAKRIRYESVTQCYCAVNVGAQRDALEAMAMSGSPDAWICTLYARPANIDNTGYGRSQ